jgi:hypothetical protein
MPLFLHTHAAANVLVRRMVELGIVVEMMGFARNRRFRYEPCVRLFTDEIPDSGTTE